MAPKETFVIDFSECSLEKAATVAALFATFFYERKNNE